MNILALAFLAVVCGPMGDATRPLERQLNPLKNRGDIPAVVDTSITLQQMSFDKYPSLNLDVRKCVSVVGYCVSAHMGGVESCNCHAKDAAHRDTHIDLVVDPANTPYKRTHIIVEVTPVIRDRMRLRGVDWSTEMLAKIMPGRKVRVTGFLFYDKEHENAAENTNPGGARNWRATCWEVHPILDMRFVQ